MKGSAIDAEARVMCKHTVVYTSAQDIACAVMAMQGRTTKAIARELGMSPHMVQYRISKAQNSLKTRFRADYRNSNGALVRQMMELTRPLAYKVVTTKVAPKFIPLAASGVGRLQ